MNGGDDETRTRDLCRDSSSINKRMAWSSDASDIASRSPASRCSRDESTGCFRLHNFQPCGRLRNPRAHDGGSICMSQLGLHGGGGQKQCIQFLKKNRRLLEDEVIYRGCCSVC